MISESIYRTDLIREKMASKGLTNDDLAEISGVSDGTISAIRNGKTTVGVHTLKKAIEPLGLSLTEIFSNPHQPAQTVDALR